MLAIAKALRTYSDHEADLFLSENTEIHNLPENDYPEFKNAYPDWIKKSARYNLKNNWNVFSKDNICKELSRYDVVLLSSFYIALAPFIKNTRIIFYVTGGDLTALPFAKTHRQLITTLSPFNPKPEIYQFLQRRGIRAVDHIITQPFSPFAGALKRLKTRSDKILNAYFPILVDVEKFKMRDSALSNLAAKDRQDMERFKFRIFHPSRVMTKDHPLLKQAGQWKRNDMLVDAFASFIKTNNIKDAGLYLISTYGGKSADVIKLKKQIAALGIEDYVVWLQPENPRGYTRNDLVNFYSASDLVADDFGAGWFGSICIEGFCASKPVLSYVDAEVMPELYPWHPFLSSNTVDGNSELISKVYNDPKFAKKQGKLGYKWANEFHSHENGAQHYLREFAKIIALE